MGKERMYEQKNMVKLPSGEEIGDHGGRLNRVVLVEGKDGWMSLWGEVPWPA